MALSREDLEKITEIFFLSGKIPSILPKPKPPKSLIEEYFLMTDDDKRGWIKAMDILYGV